MFKIRLVHYNAIVPHKNRPSDAGFDLYALESIRIPPRSQKIVDTGIELVELPDPFMAFSSWASAMFIWPRSGLAAKFAIDTGAGVIDHLYRGQILVLLKNESGVEVNIPYGTAMAQAVIQPVWVGGMEVVDYSGDSDRGRRGGIVDEAERTEL